MPSYDLHVIERNAEIEVTPRMIKAGVREADIGAEDSSESLVCRVYQAMNAARR